MSFELFVQISLQSFKYKRFRKHGIELHQIMRMNARTLSYRIYMQIQDGVLDFPGAPRLVYWSS